MKTQTLDMRHIRYLNLFNEISRVGCKSCFFYNNYIIFAVKPGFVSRAIGEGGKTARKLSSILGRRIKIVSFPNNIEDAEKFISAIVSPIVFKSLEISQEDIIITATRQSKASLIGRNKVRLIELEKIVREFFGKSLKII